MIFESHAHYDDKRFDNDRHMILSRLKNEGISYVINVGANYDSSLKSIDLSEQYDFIYSAIGVHPHDVDDFTDECSKQLFSNIKHNKVVAVGEIGLDYYYEHSKRTIQQLWFENQIEIAKQARLPIIVHSRDAAMDTINILKTTHAQDVGGVIHCYGYSRQLVSQFIDMGFLIGVGGVITFKNSKKLKEVVEYLPIENILIETDCPYLAPVPNRGKRNDSTNLKYIINAIANIKSISYEEVINKTYENAIRLFKLEDRKRGII